jgi:hypothetical protein
MSFKKFNEIAELLGIVAIVASLIFVGLQMQQSHKIAISDQYLQMVANQIAADDAIAAHADVFVRGNAGEELSPQEMAIFAGQVRNLADITWHMIEVDREMGHDEWVETDVVEFALYLYNNPGAYEVWLRREEDMDRYRTLVSSEIEEDQRP